MEESKSNGGVDDDPGRLEGSRDSGKERKVSAVFQDRGSGSSKVAKLQEAFEDLREVDPEEGMPDGIAETAEDLVSAKVMNHPDRDYRLLVACCLVEVLRIYAPEAPYGEDQQLAIFALITTQLRGLCEAGQSERFDMRTKLTKHLIQSLVHVKSCVILVFLTNDGVPGGLEQLIEMFEVLLTSVRETHPPELKILVREALELCISELEDLPQPLLDTILIQLLPVTKNENPASYNLAKELLQSTFEKVHTPISVFVNSVLSGAAASADESELKEHVLPLVYELHKVHPLMLVYIFPELAQQLKAEDIEVRSGAVSLLGRLFMSKIGNYGVERPEIWQKFLGRFIDADVTIRSTMVTAGAMIARTKPELRKELYEALRRRLHDPDAEIRKDAVRELVELAHAEPEALSRDVLEAVGQRIKDRKPIIRQAACVGLGKAYNKHVSSKWVPSQDDTQHDLEGKPSRSKGKGKEKVVSLSLPSAELSSKLGWVPSFVVKALGYRDDWGLRAKVLELLDAYIVPKHLSDEARSVGMAHLRHGMDPPARQGLTWILQDKKKVRGEVLRYLDARDAHKASPREKALALAVEARLSAIMAIHPTNGTKMTPLHDLNNKVDKKVFRLLRAVCATDASHAMVAAARSELLKKVGSRTVVGEYVRTLVYRCSVLSVGAAGFQQLCLACTKGLRDRNEESYLPPLGLLETLIGVFPEQARGQHEHLAAMFLAAQCSDLEQDAARVLSLIAAGRYCSEEQGVDRGEGGPSKGNRAEDGNEVPDEFLEDLVEICTKEGKGTPAQAPIAVRALASLASSDSAEIAEAARFAALDALRQAAAAARRPNERSYQGVVSSIAALSAFAQEFPQEFGAYEEKALMFVKARMAGGSGRRGGDDEEGDKGARGKAGGKAGKRRGGGRKAGSGAEISARCQTLCFSIRLACSCFMPTAAGNGRAARAVAGSLDVENVLKFVFGLLESEGQPPGESEMCAEEREELRVVASTCVARLCMSSRSIVTSLSPERWHALAWTMMDPSERVRAEFTREVCRNLEQTGAASGSSGEREGGGTVSGSNGTSKLRFMAYLCLAAFEGEPLRSEVRLALAKKVRQLRMAHAAAAIAAAAAASPGEGGDEDEKTAAATALQAAMPEGVLPYVIHLLAHHPDYLSTKDVAKNIQRYLEFLLGPLLGQGHEADNLSMLLQMVDTIVTSYQDALEPSNDKIHITARVARQLLTNRIRTQSNLQPYPGKIFLPAPLFQRRAILSPEGRKSRKAGVGRNQSSPEARADAVGIGGRRASGGSSSSGGSASSTSRRVHPRTSASSTSVPKSTTAVGGKSQSPKGRGKSGDTSKTRGDDRSLPPGSSSVSSSSAGLKSGYQCRSKTPVSSPGNATIVDAVTGAASPSLSPIAPHLGSPKLETRRGGGLRYRSADGSQSPQWGSPVSSSSRSNSEVDSKYSQGDSETKGEGKISTARGQATTSSRRSPPQGGLTIGTGDSAGVSRKCSIGIMQVAGSRTVRAARRSTIESPQGESERLIQQQQQASRKRSGRSPSSDVVVGSKKGSMSTKGGHGGHNNADEEDSTGPSLAKKGRRDNGRPTVSSAVAPAGTSAGKARQGKNIGRKTPLDSKQHQQSTAAAVRVGAKGTKRKSTASSGRGAEAGARASTSATIAGPTRERKQPAAKVAKRAVRDWTPVEPLSRQERAERRSRGSSLEEKPESAGGGDGEKEEDSDDEALMELARRRRAAMQG